MCCFVVVYSLYIEVDLLMSNCIYIECKYFVYCMYIERHFYVLYHKPTIIVCYGPSVHLFNLIFTFNVYLKSKNTSP